MANAFEMSLEEFSKLSLKAKNVIPITAQCTVFAESEVVSLVGEGKPMEEIAAAYSSLSPSGVLSWLRRRERRTV